MLSLLDCGARASATEISDAGDSVGDADIANVLVEGARDGVPSEPLGDRGSPQSVVSGQTIHEIASPFGDFGTIANYTPSFESSSPNGPGFDAAKGQTLRGFVDGQFNITLDGIPFQDPDTFAHHSTSYFPVAMIDQLVVDRSPGGAPDLGYASFGGSLNLFSTAIPQQSRARVYGSYGSFNTGLVGTTVSTAAPQSSGQTGVLGTIEYSHSDGAMSFSPGDKGDFFLKSETLLGDGRLTFLYTYDRYHFYNPGSLTTTQLSRYGSSFGYDDDPGTPNYFGYSATQREADFGYLKYQTPLDAAWALEDRLYTFSYENDGLSLKGDQTSSPIGNGFAGIDPDDIAGKTTSEQFRTYGNDLRVTHRNAFGELLFGVWAEHDWQNEARDAIDLTTGLLYDANKKQESPVYFAFDAHLNTVQPYAQYKWQPTSEFDVRVGLRYRAMTRDFDASVVQNFLPGTEGTVSKTVHSTLPSLDANYRIAQGINVYAQVSKGALAPSQSYFYTANASAGNQANPETATAEQIGVVTQTERYGIALDVYNVNFDNYVTTVAAANGDTIYENSGSVRYRGIESEAHLALGGGFTAVGNASLIRAIYLDSDITSSIQVAGDTIPYAPNYLALAGFTYGNGPWSGSLLTKFVGREYQGKNGSADGSAYQVNAYSYTNLTGTRDVEHCFGLQRLRFTAAVDNLFNSDAITDNAGPSIGGPNLINVLARRNYSVSFAADF
jgi:iron complex outermembrane receptor protein